MLLSLRKAAAPWLCEEMKKVTAEEGKCKNMKELKFRCLATEVGCLEAIEFLIIRLIQFSASSLDYSDMDNAELHGLSTHFRFFNLFSLSVCSEVQNFQIARKSRDRMK